MKTTRVTSKSDPPNWMIGDWIFADPDMHGSFRIAKTDHGLRLWVLNSKMNELAIVSKLRWDGRQLGFELFWRSTRFRTREVLRPVARNELELEWTHREIWVRTEGQQLRPDGPGRLARKSGPAKTELLVGRWEDPTHDDAMQIEIGVGPGGGFKVKANLDEWKNYTATPSGQFNGNSLVFTVYGPGSASPVVRMEAKPLSRRRIVFERTLWERLIPATKVCTRQLDKFLRSSKNMAAGTPASDK